MLKRNVFTNASHPHGTIMCFELLDDQRRGVAFCFRLPVTTEGGQLVHGRTTSGSLAEPITLSSYAFFDYTPGEPFNKPPASRAIKRMEGAELSVLAETQLYEHLCAGRAALVWTKLEELHAKAFPA